MPPQAGERQFQATSLIVVSAPDLLEGDTNTPELQKLMPQLAELARHRLLSSQDLLIRFARKVIHLSSMKIT